MKRVLILANGEAPSRELFNFHYRHCKFFVCADGGANTAANFNTKPDVIIGDLDSTRYATFRKFSTSQIFRIPEQNSTDLEKALHFCIQLGFADITVLGATGGRLDHALVNLSAIAKFSDRASIFAYDNQGKFQVVKKKCIIQLPIGTTLSLLPLTKCSGITTTGLKWNLRNESLQLGIRESLSNVTTKKNIIVQVKSGILVMMINYRAAKRLKH